MKASRPHWNTCRNLTTAMGAMGSNLTTAAPHALLPAHHYHHMQARSQLLQAVQVLTSCHDNADVALYAQLAWAQYKSQHAHCKVYF